GLCDQELTDAVAHSSELEQLQDSNLRHGYRLHHPGHHWMTGKMSLAKWFVNRDRPHADAFRSAFIAADDPIDHQKRITMRQNLHDLFAVEPAVAFRYHARQRKRVATRLLLGDGAS